MLTPSPTPTSRSGTTKVRWLAALATYTDRRGSGKSENMLSDNSVIENTDNVAPMFKDDNDEEITETTRKVKEDAKPNAEVIDGIALLTLAKPCRATLTTGSWPPTPTTATC